MKIGAGKTRSEDCRLPKVQSTEDGKRFLGRGTIREPETILMGHYRLDMRA
jgi:hypothetical protein